MKRRNKLNYFLSFVLITLVTVILVSLTVGVQIIIERVCHGNIGAIAGVMVAVILVVSVIVTLLNYVRRHFTVDVPVQKILDATERIATGDFTVKLEPVHRLHSYDEFDFIMENLNKMTAELNRTEMLHNNFITNVSHEIKTPLAIINNYACALAGKELDEAERKRYAQSIADASKRLSGLVANILQLSRLENQEIHPQQEKFCLSDRLAEAVVAFEERIEAKNLQLECDIEEEIYVVSSPSYLDMVWNNLISNAVKFTDNGGKIGVSLKRENGRAVVKISDTGCGISSETGKHVFEKFYQGDTSHAQEGNGLGLAIVKRIIDITGGDIKVKSAVNKGTEFTITIR